jgi:hypothetical protein
MPIVNYKVKMISMLPNLNLLETGFVIVNKSEPSVLNSIGAYFSSISNGTTHKGLNLFM